MEEAMTVSDIGGAESSTLSTFHRVVVSSDKQEPELAPKDEPEPTKLKTQHPSTPTAGSCSQPVPEEEPAAQQNTRVLVIEDLPELAEAIAEFLRAMEFQVEVAGTGEAALRILRDRPVDVALVDIDLPDSNGFEVVGIAKASGWLENTRVVFCTGNQSGDYANGRARFPESRLLWKPFRLRDLVKCLNEVRAEAIPPRN